MERPPAPPEAVLIRLAREAANIRIADAAARAGVSVARWSQIEAGSEMRHGQVSPVTGRAGTIARMAHAVPGISPERLADEGRRPDAALILREIIRDEVPGLAAAPAPDPIREAGPRTGPDDPDLQPWRQQVLREAYSSLGILGRLGPGELPEPDEIPGAREAMLGMPGALIFSADHEASAWDSDALPLERKINVIALTRRLGARADERERNRRTGLAAGYVPVSGGILVLVSVAGRAAGASH